MQIELTTTEQQFLLELLEHKFQELQREIHRTDHHEYKALLKRKEALCEALIGKTSVRAFAAKA